MKNLINLINSQTTQDYHCVYREDFDDELFYLTKALYSHTDDDHDELFYLTKAVNSHIDEGDQNYFINIVDKQPSPNIFWKKITGTPPFTDENIFCLNKKS